jgi:hypothetical protein
MSWVSQKLRSHEQAGHIDSTCYNWLIQQLYDVSKARVDHKVRGALSKSDGCRLHKWAGLTKISAIASHLAVL